jgi:hypothetical protein
LPARFYERLWLNSNLFGDRKQIGFMGFEKGDEAGEQGRLSRPPPKLVCLNSGQAQEPLCAPFVGKRRRECGKSESKRVVWRLEQHRLDSRMNG